MRLRSTCRNYAAKFINATSPAREASLLPHPRTRSPCRVQPPVLSFSLSPPLYMYMSIYIRMYRRVYTRQTSLGITHVTLRYLVPSTRAVPQLFSNNRSRSVLIPPGLSCSLFSVRIRVSHAARRNEASYYCRSAALRSSRRTLPYLPAPLSKSRQPGTKRDPPPPSSSA